MNKNKQKSTWKLSGLLLVALLAFFTLPVSAGTNPHTGIFLKEVALDTGVTLQYAEKGHGKGKVVIFLHGYTDSWFSYSGVLELLPPKYHGYALTQRGHGDSEKPAGGYLMSDFSEDVIALMDKFGIHKAHIVGHSMGSVIAQRVAIDHPDRVKKLVLIGSTADPSSNFVLLDFLSYVYTLQDPMDPAFVLDFQASTLYNPVPPEFLDTVVNESLKVPHLVWEGALAGLVLENNLAQFPLITAPTLVLWGDKDGVFSYEEQLPLVQGIPNATFLLYPDTGHGLHWEKPVEFTQDLVDFLN